jgi:hypothetical protein
VLAARPNVLAMSPANIPTGPMHSQTCSRVSQASTRALWMSCSYSVLTSFDRHRMITDDRDRVREGLVSRCIYAEAPQRRRSRKVPHVA